MGALAGLDQLQGRTDGVGGGVGGAAQQGVGLAELDEHGAEVVALLQQVAALLLGHLALAQLHHGLHHVLHVVVGQGIDDGGLVHAEAALAGGLGDLVGVADEDDVHQVVADEAVRRLEDAGVGALGEDDGAALGLECFQKLCKHSIPPYTETASRIFCSAELLYNQFPAGTRENSDFSKKRVESAKTLQCR